MEKLLDEFLYDLNFDRGLSKNTLESYGRDIRQFYNYIGESESSVFNASKATIIAYLIHLQKSGRATTSISRSLAALRSFYQFCIPISI